MAKTETLQEKIARLERENEALKTVQERGLSLKVSTKGGVSVYGLGRFPVTLYQEQWHKLKDTMPQILNFIEENKASLKAKATKADEDDD